MTTIFKPAGDTWVTGDKGDGMPRDQAVLAWLRHDAGPETVPDQLALLIDTGSGTRVLDPGHIDGTQEDAPLSYNWRILGWSATLQMVFVSIERYCALRQRIKNRDQINALKSLAFTALYSANPNAKVPMPIYYVQPEDLAKEGKAAPETRSRVDQKSKKG